MFARQRASQENVEKNLYAPWRAKRGVIFVQHLIKTCLRLCDSITCFWGEEYECCMLRNRPSNPVSSCWVKLFNQMMMNCKIQKLPPLLREDFFFFFILYTIKMESAKLTPLSDKVYSYSPTKGTTSARVAKPPALLFVTRWIIKVSLVVSLWGFSAV